jgi:uncharacterized protein (DUF934 family)
VKLLDRNGWKTDDYVRADEFFAAPAILVPIEALDAALAGRAAGQRIGVALPNTFHAADLLAVQDRLDLVAIAFPKFSDGRGFSIGKALRDQGYRGVLRAAGAIIPDQFAFALHCGFDEVEIDDAQAERQPIDQWLHALTLIHAGYQDGPDGSVSIFRRRQAAAEAA